jgi:hypothetical protein
MWLKSNQSKTKVAMCLGGKEQNFLIMKFEITIHDSLFKVRYYLSNVYLLNFIIMYIFLIKFIIIIHKFCCLIDDFTIFWKRYTLSKVWCDIANESPYLTNYSHHGWDPYMKCYIWRSLQENIWNYYCFRESVISNQAYGCISRSSCHVIVQNFGLQGELND